MSRKYWQYGTPLSRPRLARQHTTKVMMLRGLGTSIKYVEKRKVGVEPTIRKNQHCAVMSLLLLATHSFQGCVLLPARVMPFEGLNVKRLSR